MGQPKGEDKRELGLSSATALVVANMVGFGVFTTSGFLLGDLQSPWLVLIIWILGGGMAALGALNYGALSRRIPESGGEYLFLSRTLHPVAGYVAGWISLLVGFSAPLALAAKTFGDYAQPWLAPLSPAWCGTFLLLLFSAVHAFSVSRGARFQDFAVLIKIGLILFFIVWALFRLDLPAFELPALTVFDPGDSSDSKGPSIPISALGVSLMWVSLSYSGWNATVYVAGEVREPQRTLPRSLLLGVAVVTLLYLGLNAVFIFSAPVGELVDEPEIGLIAAEKLGGDNGHIWRRALSALISVALITSVSSLVMTGPRVYAKMADDGYLPRWLTPDGGPPRGAIGFQCMVALILLWTATYERLFTWIGFTLGLSTAFTVVGLVTLRLKEGKDRLPIVGWPWVPFLFLFGVLLTTILTILERPTDIGVGLGVIAAGVVAWWINDSWRGRQSSSDSGD